MLTLKDSSAVHCCSGPCGSCGKKLQKGKEKLKEISEISLILETLIDT